MNNFFLIVLDGVGIGELPDANLYKDEGSNTLRNIAQKIGGLSLPNLQKLGRICGQNNKSKFNDKYEYTKNHINYKKYLSSQY